MKIKNIKISSSLGQLIFAIIGFFVGWGLSLSFAFIFIAPLVSTDISDPIWIMIITFSKLLHIFTIFTCTYVMYILGNKLFPPEKYGFVNVKKFVWIFVEIIILSFVAFGFYKSNTRANALIFLLISFFLILIPVVALAYKPRKN